MAGIKSIYRSPDAFRLPTWDALLSYPVNSIVAYWDSDGQQWIHYISRRSTSQGSLAESNYDSDWIQFTFDSETIMRQVKTVFAANFASLVADVDSDFAAQLASLDSDNDSDFVELIARFDSDMQVQRDYLDSEIRSLRADFDSDKLVLAAIDSDQDVLIERSFRGRLYPNVDYRGDRTEQRLSNFRDVVGNIYQTQATFYDGYANHYHNVIMETNSAYSFEYGLDLMNLGAHRIRLGDGAETVTMTWDSPAFVGQVSFQGQNFENFTDYFKSAQATWNYTDGTTAVVVNNDAVFGNTERLVLENPNPNKPINNVVILAYNRFGEVPGVNYIAANTIFIGDELQTERASIYNFARTHELLRHPAHPDMIGFVANTNSIWYAKDSEWVVATPEYDIVEHSEFFLNYNFPPVSHADGTRAYVYQSGYEYYVLNNSWVLDSDTVRGRDSEKFHSLDSDMKWLKVIYHDLDSDLKIAQSIYNQTYFTHMMSNQDSEIARLTSAFNTFYREFIRIQREHKVTQASIDSDIPHWQQKFTEISATMQAYQNSIDADIVTVTNSIPGQVNAAVVVYNNDHDSDINELEDQIFGAYDSIALLRHGPVKDNDSDIQELREYNIHNDSDIEYLYGTTMKYRGFIDHTVDIPKFVNPGDVYQTFTGGYTLKPHYPGMDSEYLDNNTFIMYTDSETWMVVGQGGTQYTTNDIEVTAGFPAGTIMSFSSVDALPQSFRLCNGGFYNTTVYKELYAILGTDRLPDLRNQFLRGYNEDSDGFGNTRAVLSRQEDDFKAHNHTYDHQIVGINRGYGGQADDDDIRRTTDNTSTTGGNETRPVNTMVVFGIAMYSGAGAQNRFDSDLWLKIDENDSDIKVLYRLEHRNDWQDSDINTLFVGLDSEIHGREAADSDLQVQIIDNDSDIAKLREDVDALSATSNTAHVIVYRDTATYGTISDGTSSVISPLLWGGAFQQPWVYPQVTYYYSTTGTNVHPTQGGRQLDGTNGTPVMNTFVLHDLSGNTTVGVEPNGADLLYDVQIVSTFRTV